MPRPLLIAAVAVALALGALPPAAAVESRALVGTWCLERVAAVDGDASRAIRREWRFFADGRVRLQSESSQDVRVTTPYELDGDDLVIPRLGLRFTLERVRGGRLSALNDVGELRYVFERGPCAGG